HFATTDHLAGYVSRAGLTWKTYAEDISGTNCPLTNNGSYAVRHVGVMYFTDVTGNSQTCISHMRPYTELFTDLQNGQIPNLTYIVPNLCDNMHGNVGGCGNGNLIQQG